MEHYPRSRGTSSDPTYRTARVSARAGDRSHAAVRAAAPAASFTPVGVLVPGGPSLGGPSLDLPTPDPNARSTGYLLWLTRRSAPAPLRPLICSPVRLRPPSMPARSRDIAACLS